MSNISDLRLSKNMKYTALYVAMRFHETEPGVFVKRYDDNAEIKIESDRQKVSINGDFAFLLDTNESFVKLECINRLLTLGYSLSDSRFSETRTGWNLRTSVYLSSYGITLSLS